MAELTAEQERQAEENRRRLLEAEANALLLLLQARSQATERGARAGLGLRSIANRVETAVRGAISDARQISRATGISRLSAEVGMGGGLGEFREVLASEVGRDQARAREYARNYAGDWLRSASGDSVRQAVKTANEGSLGSLRRIGVTESSEAFNTGRAKAAQELPASTGLLRVWDSTLDKRVCPICSRADGYIVGIRERFPWGEPGTPHPFAVAAGPS